MLGQDRRPPAEMYAAARTEVAAYPSVALRDGRVEHGSALEGGFALELDDASTVWADTLLLAAGVDYRYPDLPGVAELWGSTAFHCPFCHGWEVRERPLAALLNGEFAVHGGLMLRAWSDDVTVLTDGPSTIDDEGSERLRAAGVRIDERPVAGLTARDGELAAVEFVDGSSWSAAPSRSRSRCTSAPRS
jgi:thioredoxin reductase